MDNVTRRKFMIDVGALAAVAVVPTEAIANIVTQKQEDELTRLVDDIKRVASEVYSAFDFNIYEDRTTTSYLCLRLSRAMCSMFQHYHNYEFDSIAVTHAANHPAIIRFYPKLHPDTKPQPPSYMFTPEQKKLITVSVSVNSTLTYAQFTDLVKLFNDANV